MKNFHKKAFSLVELSIVILIIGILIAGVSQGIDLYQDMRLATARSLTQNSRVNRIEDLSMWFEATSEKSFENPNPKDEERIALWKNINLKLSNRIDVTQANQASQPFYVRNAINGNPALRFDDAQFLAVSEVALFDLAMSDQVTVFFVQKTICCDSQISTFAWSSSSYRFQAHTTNHITFDFGACCTDNVSRITTGSLSRDNVNKGIVATLIRRKELLRIKINGKSIIENSTNSSVLEKNEKGIFEIGRFGNGNYLSGYLGEFIIFRRGLADFEINDVEKYLSKKWAIKIN
jgi:prepilin-type N-terminal cleavage/methylation domain-containing protein